MGEWMTGFAIVQVDVAGPDIVQVDEEVAVSFSTVKSIRELHCSMSPSYPDMRGALYRTKLASRTDARS
jgi:hypothetical protein